MIPKHLHVVWLGSAMPAWARHHLALFLDHNSSWAVTIYDEWPPDGMPPELVEIGRRCSQYCQLADLIYIWALATRGGFVLDLDNMTRRSFDALCEQRAFSTRHSDADHRLTNGVMGGGPGGAFGRALEWVIEHQAPEQVPRCHYGPDLMTRLFDDPPDDFTILPWAYFYPLHCGERRLAEAYAAAPDSRAREAILAPLAAERWPKLDGGPFCVHLWGCEGSSHKGIERQWIE